MRLLRGSVLALALTTGSLAQAQYAVFDGAAFAQLINQLAQAKLQLDQLQKTYNSFNHMTDLSVVQSMLKDPKIQAALPKNSGNLNDVFSGAHGQSASAKADNIFTMEQDNYYAASLEKAKQANGASKDLGRSIYDSASATMETLQSLQEQLAQSTDPKTTADIHAQISAVSATAQIQLLQLNAVRMLADADARTRGDQEIQVYLKSKADYLEKAPASQ